MEADPLLKHYTTLLEKAEAWQQAWAQRGEAPTASVAQLMSQTFQGATLAQQIEKRLLEGRRELDNQIARFAGTLAAAVALLCKSGNTDAIERQTQEAFLRVGKTEDGFASKLAELRPMADLYRRLKTAVG